MLLLLLLLRRRRCRLEGVLRRFLRILRVLLGIRPLHLRRREHLLLLQVLRVLLLLLLLLLRVRCVLVRCVLEVLKMLRRPCPRRLQVARILL
jgi:hypothetical protein